MTGDGLGAPPYSRNEWEDERRTLTESNRTLRSDLERQAKRIKELEEALRPFDDMYSRYQNATHWSAPYLYDDMPEVLRRAAKALETKDGNDGKTK